MLFPKASLKLLASLILSVFINFKCFTNRDVLKFDLNNCTIFPKSLMVPFLLFFSRFILMKANLFSLINTLSHLLAWASADHNSEIPDSEFLGGPLLECVST